jgi:hypothetical protein
MARRSIFGKAVILLILTGCGPVAEPNAASMHVEVRSAYDDEKVVVARAIGPLLVALGHLFRQPPTRIWLRGDCAIALGIHKSGMINSAISSGWIGSCPHLGLLLTDGALQHLPPGEMMALLAHELAHVHLGHLTRPGEPGPTPPDLALTIDETVGLTVTFIDLPSMLDGPPGRFSPADELEADRVAARLLARVGQRATCLELATLLERLARGGEPRGSWLSTHPPLDRRAREVRMLCDRGERLSCDSGRASLRLPT